METLRDDDPLKRALTILGNQSRLAAALEVKPQAVQQWLRNGVPPERVIAVAAATEFRVTPHELRPDLYPHPVDGLPADVRAVAEFSETLTAGERDGLLAAMRQGVGPATAFIDSLQLSLSVRAALLHAAAARAGPAD